MARPLLARSSIRQKRIPQADASPCKVSRVSGHHRQAVGQCDGSDLLVNLMFRMRNTKSPPDMSSVNIERKDVVAELTQHVSQPVFQHGRLLRIATMPNELNASTQLADRNDREIK